VEPSNLISCMPLCKPSIACTPMCRFYFEGWCSEVNWGELVSFQKVDGQNAFLADWGTGRKNAK
jgi:hypothetical protein